MRGAGSSVARELVRFAPHDGAHRAAIRCAVSAGVPMLVLLATGRLDLVGAAAFGAFTAIYGRNLTVPGRTLVQGVCATILTLCVAVGVSVAHLPGQPWTGLLILAVVAGLVTVAGETVGWKPGGPLFFVFAAGAFVGAPPMPPGEALGTVATTAAVAAFSVLVGSAGAVFAAHVRARRPLVVAGPRAVLAAGMPTDILIACLVTVPIAVGLGVEHTYWALVAAVVPLSVHGRHERVTRAVLRVAGTAGGLVVAGGLLALGLPVWGVAVVVVVLQACAELFVLRNYAAALLFITPLALLVSNLAHPLPPVELLLDRLVATAVGIVVALVVLVLRDRFDRRTDSRNGRNGDETPA
ncbi:FUSC family protein [Pseudonocardia phyllosphaerae]|uniref:FUSC family protein n=1 Tax=Pseudonocardia phyllosphaerae TaxID=3390502 RepID=UPI00397C32B9